MNTMKKPLACLHAFLAANPKSGSKSEELVSAVLAFVQGYHSLKFERSQVTLGDISKIEISDSGREIADWLEGDLEPLARYSYVDGECANVTRFVAKVGQLVLTVCHITPWSGKNEPDPMCRLAIDFQRIGNRSKFNTAARQAVERLNHDVCAECVNRIPAQMPVATVAEAVAKRFGRATAKYMAKGLRSSSRKA